MIVVGAPDWHELMCQMERYDVKVSSYTCYNAIIRYMSDTYECIDYVIYMTSIYVRSLLIVL